MGALRVEPRRRLDPAPEFDGSPAQILTILRHSLRRRILRLIHEAGEARSPRKLAGLLGCDLSEIAYHVDILEVAGALSLTDAISDRGATERFYASTVQGDSGLCLVLLATQRHDDAISSASVP